MIQSKQPVPVGLKIDHCKVPDDTTFIVIKVETVSPVNRQPAFPPFGFILGFDIDPAVKSTVLYGGFVPTIAKFGTVQPGTAKLQLTGNC
jgi:hypothetical protein